MPFVNLANIAARLPRHVRRRPRSGKSFLTIARSLKTPPTITKWMKTRTPREPMPRNHLLLAGRASLAS
jgi:hypothetical protein